MLLQVFSGRVANLQSHFTLYLTHNIGSWPHVDDSYRVMWEQTINDNAGNPPYRFKSNLWKKLTAFSFKQIDEYLRTTLSSLPLSVSSGQKSTTISQRDIVPLNSLAIPTELKMFISNLKKLNEKNMKTESSLRSCLEDCCGALSVGDNMRRFYEIHRTMREVDSCSRGAGRKCRFSNRSKTLRNPPELSAYLTRFEQNSSH